MILRTVIYRLCLGLLAAMLVSGCQRSSSAGKQAVDLSEGEINGYYELHKDGSLYILGSLASCDAVRTGTLLPRSVRAYSSTGQSLVYEANGAGLEQRLMAEYERRHPVSSVGLLK